jgi:hypothetical protein
MSQCASVSTPPIDLSMLVAKVAELEARVAQIGERQRIIDVYRHYTRGLNRHDMELLYGSFWPDAQINYGFHSWLRDPWIDQWQKNRYQKGLSCQAHHITNETVDIDGDSAHVESYLIALWKPPTDDKPALILAGRYIDRLDRRNGEWRIAVREFIPHFWGETTSIFHSTFTETAWPQTGFGSGDKSDPCYQRPLTSRPMPSKKED